jgi:exosome complex component RRP4
MPGDMIFEKPMRVENSYVENGKTYSEVMGLFDSEKGSLVALEGSWNPRTDEVVIGIITNSKNQVYEVDLSFYGRAILIGSKYDRHTYKPGDVVQCEVKDIENRKTVILWRPRTLYGGTLLDVKATKVPRIIGKANTMIMQIATGTKSNIVVGNNGIVWLKGGDIALATRVIRKIEDEAHTSGLTERIKKLLDDQHIEETNKEIA